MSSMSITQCQCQGCVHCHGGGCTNEPEMVIRFKRHNRNGQVAVCEMCGVILLAGYPDDFEVHVPLKIT
jgi:hypothetical protein